MYCRYLDGWRGRRASSSQAYTVEAGRSRKIGVGSSLRALLCPDGSLHIELS